MLATGVGLAQHLVGLMVPCRAAGMHRLWRAAARDRRASQFSALLLQEAMHDVSMRRQA